ncbi:MAG: hypothetical protein ACMXYE_05105 [Candidatus Woesearchaeota archaeon]
MIAFREPTNEHQRTLEGTIHTIFDERKIPVVIGNSVDIYLRDAKNRPASVTIPSKFTPEFDTIAEQVTPGKYLQAYLDSEGVYALLVHENEPSAKSYHGRTQKDLDAMPSTPYVPRKKTTKKKKTQKKKEKAPKKEEVKTIEETTKKSTETKTEEKRNSEYITKPEEPEPNYLPREEYIPPSEVRKESGKRYQFGNAEIVFPEQFNNTIKLMQRHSQLPFGLGSIDAIANAFVRDPERETRELPNGRTEYKVKYPRAELILCTATDSNDTQHVYDLRTKVR